MLPKPVYSKIIQELKKIKAAWDEDRAEDPKRAPYEIDSQLISTIEREMREGHVSLSIQAKKEKVNETLAYLEKQGLITKSPYGGYFFQLPQGTIIPTKDELIKATQRRIDQTFFGKPKDFTDE